MGWIAILGSVAVWALGWLADVGTALRWFDQAVHVVATSGLTLVLAARPELFPSHRQPLAPRLVLADLCALGIGGLWEAAEGVGSRVFGLDLIKAKYDSAMDLVADAIGALLGAALVWLVLRRSASAGSVELRARAS